MRFVVGLLVLIGITTIHTAAQEDTVHRYRDTTIIGDTTTARQGNENANGEMRKETVPTQEMTTEHSVLIQNTFGLGPRVGFYRSHDATEGSFYGGVQARARILSFIGVEGAAEYRARERFDYRIRDSIPASAKVSYVPLSLTGLLIIPIAHNFSLYALGGGAWYYTVVDYSNDPNRVDAQKTNKFGYHFGLGAEIPFSEHVALNGDYRWQFLDTKFDAGDSNSLNPKNSNGYIITGALMFYF